MIDTFDKEKAEPDVIDNTEFTMAGTLNINMPRINFLDVSSGYFEVSGYEMVRQTLENAAKDPRFVFRLLVGKDAIRPSTYDTFEEYSRYSDMFGDTMESGLKKESLNHTQMDTVLSLINLLGQDNVHVRRGSARFNHAKCYILGDEGAVVGSSNFTKSGLSGNNELNTGVWATGTWKKIRGWYERMWNEATPAKDDMIQVLEQSKFGAPATPYDIYLKMLFEKYKRILTAMSRSDTPSAATRTLAKFQQDAVYNILQTIDERGGAILADSTGLGKTHIGLEVMRKKMAEGKKVLLIAPAQIRDTVWKDKLEEVQINARIIGTEELSRKDFDVFKYKKYDFVVVDESQNFRSSTAGRRLNLMKIMSMGRRRKQVLLMSATPVNNSLMDLYYQISIITGGHDDQFIDIGIPDLYRYMRKAANHKIHDGLEKVQLLLDTVMIRRTRTFIREVYPDERLGDTPITFPKRDYRPIKYGMTDLFGNVYQDLLDTIQSLHMVPYGIERYNNTVTDEERQKHKVLAHLQVILLLKRFESSVMAIIISRENKIRLFEYFGNILKKNQIVSPKHLNKIMQKWDTQNQSMDGNEEESLDEFLMGEVEKFPLRDGSDYDIDTMLRHVKSDLKNLRRYRDALKDMPKFDKKAQAVAETILKDGILNKEGRKVLVFTEYTATALYIKDILEDKFNDKRVGLITGNVKKSKRADIIRRFSPVANISEDDTMPDEQIDILVSTEVLAEGQNLQDCNYVINYDLPWNPMRIVQRIGRVDRLTSKHDTVHSRECFPDEKLDELLTLVGKLMDKIGDINESIGLDADLLGQEASPKSFKGDTMGRIRALASGDAHTITDEMERESDMMPAKSPINEISQYIKKAGIMKMEKFSMGRRSGKTGDDNKVILAYVRETPRRRFYWVVYDTHTKRAEIVDDSDAIPLAKCGENEPTYLPMDGLDGATSFRLLLDMDAAARKEIERQSGMDYKLARSLRLKRTKRQKIVERIRDAIFDEIMAGQLPESEAESVDPILDSHDILQWSDDLEDILDEYESRKDIQSLVLQIKRMRDDIGIETDSAGSETGPPGELVLVGAIFVSH